MIQMPVLDDKSYRRIFTEALAMIPMLTDKWTDFNPQDTGIMLLELLAGMTEMQNFYLDQVGDRFYRQLLAPLSDVSVDRETDELLHGFALEQAGVRRAVTNEDYRRILMEQHKREFKLDGVNVQTNGKAVHITVWREYDPLSRKELDAIASRLEEYRLLTTRIYVEQPEKWSGSEDHGA